VRGAIPGSAPIWGAYSRFEFPNWAAKFFADALIMDMANVPVPPVPAAALGVAPAGAAEQGLAPAVPAEQGLAPVPALAGMPR
jgi:hypothetical protein